MLSVIRVERTSARDTKRDPRISWFLTLDDLVPLEQVPKRYGLRFSEEAGAQLVGDLDLGRDDLERDLPVEDRIVGLEDHAHAPTADPVDDAVLADLLGQPRRPADAHGRG